MRVGPVSLTNNEDNMITSTNLKTGNVVNQGNASIYGLHGALVIRGAAYGWSVTDVINGAFRVTQGDTVVEYKTV